MRLRRYTCVAVWMACFAILLASLAPAISHAINAARIAQPAQHEHCLAEQDAVDAGQAGAAEHGAHLAAEATADGLDAADAPDASYADHAPNGGHAPSHGLHFEHCPFCYTHAGSFALITGFAAQPLMAGAAAQRPLLFYRSHQPLHAWASAEPRAPPAVS